MDKAIFAAGCFWGVEHTFAQLPGVTTTAVGYSGGTTENPTYEQVCSHGTGHAEVVEVTYDPLRISYDQLLDAFFELHDPTQVDRQGPDVGTQYRSAIFTLTPDQERAARDKIAALEASGRYGLPIATEITAASTFWRAEEYHQKYFQKNGVTGCGI